LKLFQITKKSWKKDEENSYQIQIMLKKSKFFRIEVHCNVEHCGQMTHCSQMTHCGHLDNDPIIGFFSMWDLDHNTCLIWQ